VTSADTSAAIHGDTTANNELCTDCHKTVTKATPHVQRRGMNGVAGGVQFDSTYSGHRVYSSMGGALTGGFPGVAYTWTLPADSVWLNAGWTSTSMVLCGDCHGKTTGATGPHGATMKIGYATNPNTGLPYTNAYTSGALFNNGSGMSTNDNLCIKCHPTTVVTQGGAGHTRGDHQGDGSGNCTMCHTPIPHGWKRPRLLGYTTDPAPYATSGLTGIAAQSYTAGGVGQNQCSTNCGGHNNVTAWP
jgi:hypothetical protein